jgi:hypothetical protein
MALLGTDRQRQDRIGHGRDFGGVADTTEISAEWQTPGGFHGLRALFVPSAGQLSEK